MLKNLPWQQIMLLILLFKEDASVSLPSIITKLHEETRKFGQCTDALWSLLKLYANVRNSDDSLKEFANDYCPTVSSEVNGRDHRIRWIMQLVYRSHSVMME